MRRQLSLIALFLTVALASACAAPSTGPSNDDTCIVVVGTQTRCEK